MSRNLFYPQNHRVQHLTGGTQVIQHIFLTLALWRNLDTHVQYASRPRDPSNKSMLGAGSESTTYILTTASATDGTVQSTPNWDVDLILSIWNLPNRTPSHSRHSSAIEVGITPRIMANIFVMCMLQAHSRAIPAPCTNHHLLRCRKIGWKSPLRTSHSPHLLHPGFSIAKSPRKKSI